MELIMLSTTAIVTLLIAELADLVVGDRFDRPAATPDQLPRRGSLTHPNVPVTVAGAMPVTSDDHFDRAA